MTPPGNEAAGRDGMSEAVTYAAFMSYSRVVDGGLAPALQVGLQRFAKPWWRIRALRVFRDDANLTANPGLWSSIQRGLDKSEHFILLASRKAADSKWVRQEIEYWLDHNSPDKVLIVLTDAEVDQSDRVDWAKTKATCLPSRLRDALHEEPRFVDLHWAHREEHISSRNPRFRECLADLAAPLHGRPKEELWSEDLLQHRRTRRWVRSAVATLAVLTIVSTATAVEAVRQRNAARTQTARAEARQYAAQSSSANDPYVALLLAVAAEQRTSRPLPEARVAFAAAAQRSSGWVSRFVTQLPATAGSRNAGLAPALSWSADGTRLTAGKDDGSLLGWRLSPSAVTRTQPYINGSGKVGWSADRRHLILTQYGGGLTIIDADSSVTRGPLSGCKPDYPDIFVSATLSPDARTAAMGTFDGRVVLCDAHTGMRLKSSAPGPHGEIWQLAWSPDGAQLLAAGSAGVRL